MSLSNVEQFEGKFQKFLEILSPGQSPVKIAVRGQIEIPNISITPESIQYHDVILGQSRSQPLSISNQSKSNLDLILDLSQYNQFSLDLDSSTAIIQEISPCNKPVSVYDSLSLVESRQLVMMVGKPQSKIDWDVTCGGQTSRIFKISVPGTSNVQVSLVYNPIDIENFHFSLPLSISGLPDDVIDTCQVSVSSFEGSLLLSHNNLNFGQKVVVSSSTEEPWTLYQNEISLTCVDPIKPVKFELFLEDSENFALNFASKSNKFFLTFEEIFTFSVAFTPTKLGTFNSKLLIKSDDGQSQSVYLAGESTAPSLLFSHDRLSFPPAPVGFELKTTMSIHNVGFSNITLEIRLPPEELQIPISAEFVSGNKLDFNQESVDVLIKINSPKPISFVCLIDFLAGDGLLYSVPCSGVFDDSMMTLFPLFSRNFENFIHLVEDGRLQKDSIEVDQLFNNISNFSDTQSCSSSFVALGNFPSLLPPTTPYLQEVITSSTQSLIQCYLNCFILSQKNLQGCDHFFANNFKNFKILVAKVTGKPIDTFAREKFSDAFDQQLKFVEKCCRLLKSYGLLINVIRPEYLLPQSSFIEASISELSKLRPYLNINDPHVRQSLHNHYTSTFELVSTHSWSFLLHQCVKTSLTDQLSVDVMGNDLIDDGHGMIVCYSERTLLQWVNLHVSKIFSNFKNFGIQVTNFDFDFCSCIPLACLLYSYLPLFCKDKFSFIQKFSSMSDVEYETCQVLIDSEKEKNAGEILDVLHNHLGFPTGLKPNDLLFPIARNMIVLLSMLAHILPNFEPQSEIIQFYDKLSTTAVKAIKVSNPTDKQIDYRIVLFNNNFNNFSSELEFLSIPSKSQKSLKISYYFRFSKSESSQLYLIPLKVDISAPAPLVFNLMSKTKAAPPAQKVELTGHVYALTWTDFQITNPFDSDVNLELSASLLDVTSSLSYSGSDNVTTPLKCNPFMLKSSQISLSKGATCSISIGFLPLVLGNFAGKIDLIDSTIGEFSIDLAGESSLPLPCGTIEIEGQVDQDIAVTYPINFKNLALDKVFSMAKNLNNVESFYNSMIGQSSINYKIIQNSTDLSIPDTLTLSNSRGSKIKKTGSLANLFRDQSIMSSISMRSTVSTNQKSDSNKLVGTFKTSSSGRYDIRIILASCFDIRVFKLSCQISSPMSSLGTLEFQCEIGKTITQKIPVFANSDLDNEFDVVFDCRDWSGPNHIKVPSQSHQLYPITFKPRSLDHNVSGKISFRSKLDQKFNQSYQLIGQVSLPKFEKNLKYSVFCRQPESATLTLPDLFPIGSVIKIKTDLECLGGSQSITIKSVPAKYDFSIYTTVSGLSDGQISFENSDNANLNATFNIVIDSKDLPPIDTIEVETSISETSVIAVELFNPLSVDVNFSVDFSGPYLEGPLNFSIARQSSLEYEFMYVPFNQKSSNISNIFEGQSLSGFIKFIPNHEDLPVSWYQLVLTATAPDCEDLGVINAPLGSINSKIIEIFNPTAETITIQSDITNPRNFALQNPTFKILAQSTEKVHLLFKPSRFETVSSLISFSCVEFPFLTWSFEVKGQGEKPSITDEFLIECVFSVFKNPFEFPVSFNIAFSHESTADGFDISEKVDNGFRFGNFVALIKTKEFFVNTHESLTIPILFTTDDVKRYQSFLIVSSSQSEVMENEFNWIVPIVGQSKVVDLTTKYTVSGPTRFKTQQSLKFSLTYLKQDSTFDVHLESPDHTGSSQLKLIEEWLLFPEVVTSVDHVLELPFDFLPFKSISSTFNVIFTDQQSGGRWVIPINVVADGSSSIDEEVSIIVDPLNKKNYEEVEVTLKNHLISREAVKYTASFIPSLHFKKFSVAPSSGILTPNLEDFKFLVKFDTSNFSSKCNAILLISCWNFEWRISLTATYSNYRPPSGNATFSSYLDSKHLSALKKAKHSRPKNYVKNNIARLGLK
ncbi:hypothetical protein GEMRC1_003562 [Eukaryota sp. GEM-RC1]